jgi:hypothetical protein
MQRLISLFATIEQETRLSRPTSGPPPTPQPPDYQREPVYFEHLLAYLKDQRADRADAAMAADTEGAYA